MARGAYSEAEALIARGREIKQFDLDVEGVRKRWRELRGVGGAKGKKTRTPQWVYYQPILRALINADGECRTPELESAVGELLASDLPAADREPAAGGRERWRVMIRRARRHLVSEGWIDDRKGPWRITEAGRRAAERPSVAH